MMRKEKSVFHSLKLQKYESILQRKIDNELDFFISPFNMILMLHFVKLFNSKHDMQFLARFLYVRIYIILSSGQTGQIDYKAFGIVKLTIFT